MKIECARSLKELAEEYYKGNITLFIGSGCSMSFGIPSWGQLLTRFIREYRLYEDLQVFYKNKFSFEKMNGKEAFLKWIEDGELDYLKLAEELAFLTSKDKLKSFICNQVTDESYCRLRSEVLEFIDNKESEDRLLKICKYLDREDSNKKIREIYFNKVIEEREKYISSNRALEDENYYNYFSGPELYEIKKIIDNICTDKDITERGDLYRSHYLDGTKNYIKNYITTNYDDVIEEFLSSDYISFENVISRESDFKVGFGELGNPNIYKIHGDLNEPNKIIITESDYANFKESDKLLFYKLECLFSDTTVMFVGYSLSDINIRSFLYQMKEKRERIHYFISYEYVDKLKRDFIFRMFNIIVISPAENENLDLPKVIKCLKDTLYNDDIVRQLENKLKTDNSLNLEAYFNIFKYNILRYDEMIKFITKLNSLNELYSEVETRVFSAYIVEYIESHPYILQHISIEIINKLILDLYVEEFDDRYQAVYFLEIHSLLDELDRDKREELFLLFAYEGLLEIEVLYNLFHEGVDTSLYTKNGNIMFIDFYDPKIVKTNLPDENQFILFLNLKFNLEIYDGKSYELFRYMYDFIISLFSKKKYVEREFKDVFDVLYYKLKNECYKLKIIKFNEILVGNKFNQEIKITFDYESLIINKVIYRLDEEKRLMEMLDLQI